MSKKVLWVKVEPTPVVEVKEEVTVAEPATAAEVVTTAVEANFTFTQSQLSDLINSVVAKAVAPMQEEINRLKSEVATFCEKGYEEIGKEALKFIKREVEEVVQDTLSDIKKLAEGVKTGFKELVDKTKDNLKQNIESQKVYLDCRLSRAEDLRNELIRLETVYSKFKADGETQDLLTRFRHSDPGAKMLTYLRNGIQEQAERDPAETARIYAERERNWSPCL